MIMGDTFPTISVKIGIRKVMYLVNRVCEASRTGDSLNIHHFPVDCCSDIITECWKECLKARILHQ